MDFLEKEAQFLSEKCQVDEYFSPVHKDFLSVRPVAEWLRLRDAEGVYSFNYKNWHFDENGKSHYCDEVETKLESIEAARNILLALNFKRIVKVHKLRRVWTYDDFEVAVDAVENLGDFVEIEYIGKNTNVDPKRMTEEMVDFLKGIGCGNIKRNYVGYPFLMLFPDEALYENN